MSKPGFNWELSIQIHLPVREILHSNYNRSSEAPPSSWVLQCHINRNGHLSSCVHTQVSHQMRYLVLQRSLCSNLWWWGIMHQAQARRAPNILNCCETPNQCDQFQSQPESEFAPNNSLGDRKVKLHFPTRMLVENVRFCQIRSMVRQTDIPCLQ